MSSNFFKYCTVNVIALGIFVFSSSSQANVDKKNVSHANELSTAKFVEFNSGIFSAIGDVVQIDIQDVDSSCSIRARRYDNGNGNQSGDRNVVNVLLDLAMETQHRLKVEMSEVSSLEIESGHFIVKGKVISHSPEGDEVETAVERKYKISDSKNSCTFLKNVKQVN